MLNLEDAKTDLANQIRLLAERVAKKNKSDFVQRLECGLAPVDLLKWLSVQNVDQRFYWADQDAKFFMAGIGMADEVSPDNTAFKHHDIFKRFHALEDNVDVRFYGGLCFDEDNLDETWGEFGRYRFAIPAIEIIRRGEQYFLCANIVADNDVDEAFSTALSVLSEMETEVTKSYNIPNIKTFLNLPDNEDWHDLVAEALSQINDQKLNKIVLSRKSIFSFTEAINPCAFLKELENLAPASSRFLFQFDREHSFFGASPEKLYHREGEWISSDAIAGTRAKIQGSNDQIKQDLLASKKDLKEHQFVVDFIEDQFTKLCSEFKRDSEPSILELNHSFHLITHFEGRLNADVDDVDLLFLLHPTPAVAGVPTEGALKEIARLEPFSRGWFASPVACIGRDVVDIVVAIRSAFVKEEILHVYAGAGIVEGSDAQSEWEEIDNKIYNMKKMLERLMR